MARHTALVRRPAPVLHFPTRRGGRMARFSSGAKHVARRGLSHGKKALPTIGVALGAAVVGYAQGKGFLDKLPAIGGSKVMTLGIAGFLATRFVSNPHVRAAGLAAIALAAADFGRVQGGGVSGIDDGSGSGGF